MVPLLAAVIAAFVVTQITIVTTTVYLHRALSHRALTVSPDRRIAVPVRDLDHHRHATRASGSPSTASIMRPPTPTDDPHSPAVVGFWRVQLGNVGLYKRVARDDVDGAQVRA